MLVGHLEGESFTVPRIDAEHMTCKDNFVSVWSHIVAFESSPDSVATSALIVSTVVESVLAGFFGGSAIGFPKAVWVGDARVVVGRRDFRELGYPFDGWVEIVLEVHVTVTDGLVTSGLI